jgi:hypothetical protein
MSDFSSGTSIVSTAAALAFHSSSMASSSSARSASSWVSAPCRSCAPVLRGADALGRLFGAVVFGEHLADVARDRSGAATAGEHGAEQSARSGERDGAREVVGVSAGTIAGALVAVGPDRERGVDEQVSRQGAPPRGVPRQWPAIVPAAVGMSACAAMTPITGP